MDTNLKFPALSGTFLHGFDLSNFTLCWNVSLQGTWASPDFTAFCTNGEKWHHPIRELPLEYLYRPDNSKGGICAPRSMYVWFAGFARSTGELKIGADPPKVIPPERVQKIIEIADSEIEFEKVRRVVAPNAPSRLSCIYLAEHSTEGEELIRCTLHRRNHIFIAPVKVPIAFRIAKADSRWIDEFFIKKDVTAIESYWAGKQFSDVTSWEYLIDGLVMLADPSDIEVFKDQVKNLVPSRTSPS